MPKRLNTRKFTSEVVQGDDSWVVLKRATMGEGKEAGRLNTDIPIDGDGGPDRANLRSDRNNVFLANRVVEWNWVDDAGTPLPQPKDDPNIVDSLTDLEIDWLIDHAAGRAEEWLKST